MLGMNVELVSVGRDIGSKEVIVRYQEKEFGVFDPGYIDETGVSRTATPAWGEGKRARVLLAAAISIDVHNNEDKKCGIEPNSSEPTSFHDHTFHGQIVRISKSPAEFLDEFYLFADLPEGSEGFNIDSSMIEVSDVAILSLSESEMLVPLDSVNTGEKLIEKSRFVSVSAQRTDVIGYSNIA